MPRNHCLEIKDAKCGFFRPKVVNTCTKPELTYFVLTILMQNPSYRQINNYIHVHQHVNHAHYRSSIVLADFASIALGAVYDDDASITGCLELINVGISTSVWYIPRPIRLEDHSLHRVLEK